MCVGEFRSNVETTMITNLSAAFCAALLALTPVSHALRVGSLRTQQVAAHVSSENDQDAAVTAATFDALRVSHRRLMVRFHIAIVLQCMCLLRNA
jgi:hypothetical protein